MTDYALKILRHALIIGLSLFVWVRPLFYAYHHHLFFDFVQFGLLGLCIILLLSISIKLNPLKLSGFIILPLLMMSYPYFHQKLVSFSEKIFFELRQNGMEKIVEEIKNDPSVIESEQMKNKIKKLDIHGIEYGKNYIAFGVNSFLDNTDGFIYMEHGEFPNAIFEGNLIYKETIDDNWFSFSTR